jgi:hypothetical protein
MALARRTTFAVFLLGACAQARGQGPVALDLAALTVPSVGLPATCALATRQSEPTGYLFSTNPWRGADPRRVAAIRGRMDPPRIPDGPPLTRPEMTAYNLRLAEGVAEAYLALYRQTGLSQLISVHGLRFEAVEEARQFAAGVSVSSRSSGVVASNGPIVAMAFGPQGACLDAVRAHLRGL